MSFFQGFVLENDVVIPVRRPHIVNKFTLYF